MMGWKKGEKRKIKKLTEMIAGSAGNAGAAGLGGWTSETRRSLISVPRKVMYSYTSGLGGISFTPPLLPSVPCE